jgi:hypothetical protein
MNDGELKESANDYRTVQEPSPYAALAEELYLHRVERARKMPAAEKILAGQRLFEMACQITLAGIHNQFPDYTEEQCREVLRQRLISRRKRQAAE